MLEFHEQKNYFFLVVSATTVIVLAVSTFTTLTESTTGFTSVEVPAPQEANTVTKEAINKNFNVFIFNLFV